MPRFNIDDYVDVQTRITQFWHDHPDGRIETFLLSDPGSFDQVVIRAEVYKHRDHDHPDASDLAAEERGKGGMANTTSWHENCATSAIGRALANMGYATSGKDRPSREEMAKTTSDDATTSQRPPARISERKAQHAEQAQAGTDHSEDPDWQAANKRLHATAAHVISSNGDEAHTALHEMAVRVKKAGSLKNLPADQLDAMRTFIESEEFDAWFAKQLRPYLPAFQQQQIGTTA